MKTFLEYIKSLKAENDKLDIFRSAGAKAVPSGQEVGKDEIDDLTSRQTTGSVRPNGEIERGDDYVPPPPKKPTRKINPDGTISPKS